MSSSQSVEFHLDISADPEVVTSDFTGTGVALSERANGSLLVRIAVDSRLCVVRLGGSRK